MKQKFTSEKNKYLENKNKSENKTMFNFKISCLMKKQFINVMMTLAIVFGLSASAWAQNGTGLTPDSERLVAEGSTTQFSIDNDGTFAVDINWEVFDATTAQATGFTTTGLTSATDPTQYEFVTSLTNAAVAEPDVDALAAAGTSNSFVKWMAVPENNLFIVQATATTDGGSCVTIRRFYISVFTFDVQVYLASDDVGSDPVSTAKTACNSWDALVIANSTATPEVTDLEGTEITNPHANYVNIDGGVNKYTDTYFRVDVSLTGAPTGFGIEDLKWRFAMTTPNIAGMSIYSVRNVSAPGNHYVGFGSQAGNPYLGEDDLGTPTATNEIAAMAGTVYVPAATSVDDGTTTGTYVFRVRTHNNLGDADMVYDVQLDRADLEFTLAEANTDYNNGTKVHSASGLAFPKLTDAADNTSTQTIQQTPATGIITITD